MTALYVNDMRILQTLVDDVRVNVNWKDVDGVSLLMTEHPSSLCFGPSLY